MLVKDHHEKLRTMLTSPGIEPGASRRAFALIAMATANFTWEKLLESRWSWCGWWVGNSPLNHECSWLDDKRAAYSVYNQAATIMKAMNTTASSRGIVLDDEVASRGVKHVPSTTEQTTTVHWISLTSRTHIPSLEASETLCVLDRTNSSWSVAKSQTFTEGGESTRPRQIGLRLCFRLCITPETHSEYPGWEEYAADTSRKP